MTGSELSDAEQKLLDTLLAAQSALVRCKRSECRDLVRQASDEAQSIVELALAHFGPKLPLGREPTQPGR